MTKQASIWTLFLTETQRHIRTGNIIDLMVAGAEQQRLHDSGHVARNAAAAFGSCGMMGVRCELRRI